MIFLNDVDLQLFLEFRTVLENIIQSFLKINKGLFFGHPVYKLSLWGILDVIRHLLQHIKICIKIKIQKGY